LPAPLSPEEEIRREAAAELRWKTAFLEAQVNSSIDGILVVDPQGKKILQNQRTADLLKIPRHIAENKDDEPHGETPHSPGQVFVLKLFSGYEG